MTAREAKELLDAMNQECQITNGPQSMSKLQNGRYLLCCDTAGCCDSEMTNAEAYEYIASDDVKWSAIVRNLGILK